MEFLTIDEVAKMLKVDPTDIMSLMGKLNEENGLTFVLVTHDRGIGAECDRVVSMVDGEIVDQSINRPMAYADDTAAD